MILSLLLKLGLEYGMDIDKIYGDIRYLVEDEEIFTREEFEDEFLESIDECGLFKVKDIYNKLKFGEVKFTDDYITFNGYGNFESFNYDEFVSRVNMLIDDNLDYNRELREYFNELFNICG